MTFVPESINREYQYIWTSAGLVEAPVQQQEVQIPLVTQDVPKSGDTGSFTFLQASQNASGVPQPNSVFGQATASKASPEVTNPIASTQPSVDTNIAFKKTGESFDEKMSRYYSKYKNASPEEQEKLEKKYITQHYASLEGKSRAEQIRIQLADFKKMLSNTRDPQVRERLVIRIQDLEKENQILAAQNATVEEKDAELKKSGEMGVAKSLHNYHKDNQVEATKIVVGSKNEDAILEGSTHASELDKDNQIGAVDIYKTADISKEAKLELGERLVDQYKKFDVDNQTDIHKIMSDKKYWDEKTVVYAASNIYQLDKTNQAQAVQITSDTKIEAAIKAAADNYQYYDKDAQGNIKSIIYNSDCDSAKGFLEEKINDNDTEPRFKNEMEEDSNIPPMDEDTYASQTESNVPDKIDAILELGDAVKPEDLKSLTDTQKSELLNKCSGDKNIIAGLIDSDPSEELMNEILAYMNEANLPEKDQTELMGIVGESGAFKGSNSKLPNMNSKFQEAYIAQLAPEELRDVNKEKLSALAQDKYAERIKELKINNNAQTKFGLLIG